MSLLLARGICKFYPTSSGGFFALRKTSLAFPKVGLVAIKGKSGSGKSTLLNILAGIETPTKGTVVFQNGTVGRKGSALLGKDASMVFQHYNLIMGESALYNVTLPLLMKKGAKKKAKEALKTFGLLGLAHKKVDVLSGGERQRVAICRALVTDPKIIFADEPTGALDEANSTLVMEALKGISKNRLVIMVSHNQELISTYADRVIEIVDGRIVRDSSPAPMKLEGKTNKRYPHSSSWVGRFLIRNLKKHALKDTTCLLAGFVGFTAVLLSLGYLVGNMPAMEGEMANTLTYLSASISTRTTMEIPGSSLTLVKRAKPSLDGIQATLPNLHQYDVVDDYGYFFPSSMTFSHQGVSHDPVAFSPLYDITLSEYGSNLVVDGGDIEGSGLTEAVVNQEFVHKYQEVVVGDKLLVSSRFVVTFQGKQTELFLETELTVKAVVKEFGFLNVPRVYYSYFGLKQRLENMDVEGSDGDRVSLTELLESSPSDSAYTNYGSLLFIHNPDEVPSLFSTMKEMGTKADMEITSNVYSLHESFSSLSNAFTSSLGLFVGIAFVGLVLILGMGSFSSLVQGRKENAVLLTLGASAGDVRGIYCIEAMALCLAASLLSLIFVPLLQRFANFLLYREFDIPTLIRVPLDSFLGIPLGLIWIVLVGSLVLGFVSSFVPLKISGRIALTEELRDE